MPVDDTVNKAHRAEVKVKAATTFPGVTRCDATVVTGPELGELKLLGIRFSGAGVK